MSQSSKTYTLKVIALIRENKDSVTICFKQPALKKIQYQPGQYITLILSINGRKYRRPYSFSSAPGLDATLNITVKRVEHGVVSNYLNDSVNEGDLLEVLEPMGDFVLNPDTKADHLVLWGAGSGITPLYSILKASLPVSAQFITLVYCNRDEENTLFNMQLLELQERYPAKFRLCRFFTRTLPAGADNGCFPGRVGADQIRQVMDRLTGNVSSALHFICGPHEMKELIRNTLQEYHTNEVQIFTEDFEHIADESVLEGVHTQPVTLVFNGSEEHLEVVRGKSILEAGLDRGLDLPYSCQNGTCTLCMGKLVAGQLKMAGGDINRSELSADEYLLCCSYPLSGDVEIIVN